MDFQNQQHACLSGIARSAENVNRLLSNMLDRWKKQHPAATIQHISHCVATISHEFSNPDFAVSVIIIFIEPRGEGPYRQ